MAKRDAEFRDFALGQAPTLRRLAYAVAGDWHRADGLVQETFERASVRWARVRAADDPAAYVCAILMNVAIRGRGRPWRRRAHSTEVVPNASARADHPDQVDGWDDLGQALSGLTGKQRAILALRFVEDRSLQEVAAILGIAKRTVQREAHDAVSRLRAQAVDSDDLPPEQGPQPYRPDLTTADDWDVGELVLRAAERTAPPESFDVAPALGAGRRRRAARRRAAVAVCAALTVAAALAVLPQRGTGRASGPGPSRHGSTDPSAPAADPSTGAASPDPEVNARERLDRVLADPDADVLDLQIADRAHGSVVLRHCGGDGGDDCDSVLVVTDDGWRTRRALLLAGSMAPWTRSLPDGSVVVAAMSSDHVGAQPELLRPDGSLVPLKRVRTSTRWRPGTTQLTRDPDRLQDPSAAAALLLVDPDRLTLSPVETPPPGDGLLGEPVVTPDGSVALALLADASPPRLRVARTADGGRTWTSTVIPADTRHGVGESGLAAGPAGTLSVAVVLGDGSAVPSRTALWTSRDGGRTWATVNAQQLPTYVDGMAYLYDGTLLLAGETGQLWRQPAGGGPFTPAPGPPDSEGRLRPTGDGDVVVSTGPRGFAISSDGVTWTQTQLPTDPTAYTVVGPYDHPPPAG